jgi:predicted TIM-barrel fold metal-dependent hydrolase
MVGPIISSDSHVAENADAFAQIDPKFRDRAPRQIEHEKLGAAMVLDGVPMPVPMGMLIAAGRKPEEIPHFALRWDELNAGGWDPKARLDAQDLDGIHAEVLYPSVGMVLCNHPDIDYMKACLDAYNRWLAEFCATSPSRLIGIGLSAVRSVEEAVEDLRAIKAAGFKGAMLPGFPSLEDYDQPLYDPLWEAAVDLELPISFHILTTRGSNFEDQGFLRGPPINKFMGIIRGNQDLMGMFVFGGVFERHPKLKLVCVEADAGWVPHYMYRMDHAFKRHRFWLQAGGIERLPSEYFKESIYVTFQDDMVTTHMSDLVNMRRIMWANDFPHSDSTWPWSQQVIAELTRSLSEEETRWLLHDNVAELYGLGL